MSSDCMSVLAGLDRSLDYFLTDPLLRLHGVARYYENYLVRPLLNLVGCHFLD
ncbi:hypothetical protein HanIR_Chr01g0049621 [Helianthus annuus]|nr:hypothetical protein HanIR_Chr01g0049621 [Helianthus annuus]